MRPAETDYPVILIDPAIAIAIGKHHAALRPPDSATQLV
jgi:hypothetical protein